MRLGPFGVVDLALPEGGDVGVVAGLGRRVVAQLPVLDDGVAHVDAEPGHPPVEPEPQDPVELLPYVLTPPVEVGLGGQEVVEVVLAGDGVECPGRAPELARQLLGGDPSGFPSAQT